MRSLVTNLETSRGYHLGDPEEVHIHRYNLRSSSDHSRILHKIQSYPRLKMYAVKFDVFLSILYAVVENIGMEGYFHNLSTSVDGEVVVFMILIPFTLPHGPPQTNPSGIPPTSQEVPAPRFTPSHQIPCAHPKSLGAPSYSNLRPNGQHRQWRTRSGNFVPLLIL
jgi:hypothetical protein